MRKREAEIASNSMGDKQWRVEIHTPIQEPPAQFNVGVHRPEGAPSSSADRPQVSKKTVSMTNFIDNTKKPDTGPNMPTPIDARHVESFFLNIRTCFMDGRYPESTDMCCFNCCHKFDSIPLRMPTKYDQYRDKFTGCMGVYCSWSCMKRDNQTINDAMTDKRRSLISLLVTKVEGTSRPIRMAPPPRATLQIFVGEKGLSISQYRTHLDMPMQTLQCNIVWKHLDALCISSQERVEACCESNDRGPYAHIFKLNAESAHSAHFSRMYEDSQNTQKERTTNNLQDILHMQMGHLTQNTL